MASVIASSNADCLDPADHSLSLEEMLCALPGEIFELSSRKAFKTLMFSVLAVALGVVMISILPWYLLPLGWLFMGTATTGLFAVGYSCGQNMCFKNKITNYLVGTLCMLPLMYPLEYWKSYTKKNFAVVANYSARVANSPFWFFSSLFQWFSSNFTFDFSRRMVVSASFLYIFIAIFFPLMSYGLGLWGLFKYYFIPLLVYHFWMSTFLKANVVGLFSESPVFWEFPYWVRVLSNDFNHGMTLVQNASSKLVPSPKWGDAYQELKNQWGQNIPVISFGYLFLPSLKKDKLQQARRKSLSPPSSPILKAKPTLRPTLQPILKPTETIPKPSEAIPKPVEEKSTMQQIGEILSDIYWPTTSFLFITPILGLYGVLTTPFDSRTYILAFVCYYIAGLGITAGYHRLFSHRSFDASFPVKLILTIMGTSAFEMSVLDWCADHRAHHRYTDTDKDPYNVKKGFWWAHMGWLMFKRKEEVQSDISDLKKDWLLRFQHKFFLPLSLFVGFIVPMLIAGYFWGDWKGGFLIAGVLSKVIMLHCTFCINSLAHYIGEATYSDQRSSRDSFITALVTFGEGYHNFHHEFPYDYRNGVHLSAYDPGKWLIAFFSWFGLAYNLKRFPGELFEKAKIQMAQKKIEKKRSKYFWGKSIDTLPIMTSSTVLEMNTTSPHTHLVIISNIVYDVTAFAEEHPGGKKILATYFGKDATKAFNGGVYDHSYAARNILDTFRVGRIVEEKESEGM